MRVMVLDQNHIKTGINSTFNLLTMDEFQAIIEDEGFQSEGDKPLAMPETTPRAAWTPWTNSIPAPLLPLVGLHLVTFWDC
jgi:hypothetical protein